MGNRYFNSEVYDVHIIATFDVTKSIFIKGFAIFLNNGNSRSFAFSFSSINFNECFKEKCDLKSNQPTHKLLFQ